VSAPPIRRPRPDELEALVGIEREAGALFKAIGMPEIAYDDPGTWRWGESCSRARCPLASAAVRGQLLIEGRSERWSERERLH
jgi:hypothetical protein